MNNKNTTTFPRKNISKPQKLTTEYSNKYVKLSPLGFINVFNFRLFSIIL